MTATTTTALVPLQPAFSDAKRLALAGFLAGYHGLTRESYALDLPQFTIWCRARSLNLFGVRAATVSRAAGTVAVSLLIAGLRSSGLSCQKEFAHQAGATGQRGNAMARGFQGRAGSRRTVGGGSYPAGSARLLRRYPGARKLAAALSGGTVHAPRSLGPAGQTADLTRLAQAAEPAPGRAAGRMGVTVGDPLALGSCVIRGVAG